MTFSKPKRAPNVVGSVLETDNAFVFGESFRRNPDSVVYRLDVFRLPADFIWKRALDIVLSTIAIFLLAPFILFTAVLIKLTSPGPVLFYQERIGLNRRTYERRRRQTSTAFPEQRRQERRKSKGYGKPFRIYKFRTMVTDAEKNGKPMLARKGDPRITPIGALLRRTRIDELPQFFNVLMGDMSIVGPRPERAFFIEEMKDDIPNFPHRLRAKPGITGLAQVESGYASDTEGMRRKLKWDLKYIQSLSLYNDLKIMFKTFSVVLTGKGAC